MLAAKLRLILDETANQYSRYHDDPDFDIEIETGMSVVGAFELGLAEGEINFAMILRDLLTELEHQEYEIDGE